MSEVLHEAAVAAHAAEEKLAAAVAAAEATSQANKAAEALVDAQAEAAQFAVRLRCCFSRSDARCRVVKHGGHGASDSGSHDSILRTARLSRKIKIGGAAWLEGAGGVFWTVRKSNQ